MLFGAQKTKEKKLSLRKIAFVNKLKINYSSMEGKLPILVVLRQ
jgi:hypothetical protein